MDNRSREFKFLAVGGGIFLIAFSWTQTLTISLALTAVAILISVISNRTVDSKRNWLLFQAIPEIIDHVITGVQSGLSLNEALVSLGTRGPKIAQTHFLAFEADLLAGMNFEQAISHLQSSFGIRAADQLFESLIFAKSLGGSELLALLRQLGDFTRQDLTLRREIIAKQGWIRNSAHLSAAAPWILLLLLSAQPSTAEAFNSSTGIFILSSGIGATAVAYMWMGHLSKLPEPVRIFGKK